MALVLLSAIQLIPLLVFQPFYLSYYNLAAGSLPGANRLGLETTYWCEAIDHQVIGHVNETATTQARVAVFPFAPGSQYVTASSTWFGGVTEIG